MAKNFLGIHLQGLLKTYDVRLAPSPPEKREIASLPFLWKISPFVTVVPTLRRADAPGHAIRDTILSRPRQGSMIDLLNRFPPTLHEPKFSAMSVLVAQQAPDFKATAVMPDGQFKDISLSDYRGKYVLLFFWPLDFTFVCPTEIIAFSDREKDFSKLGVQILGVSIDSHFTHLAWTNTDRKDGGIGKTAYPLIADLNKQICRDYDVLLDGGVALRGLFLIDKSGVVRHQVVNDLPLGRSVDEALRMVKALHFFETNGEVCPANWQEGSRTIQADVEGSKKFFKAQYAS
jgi:alkyl hydroperoxide reductase subunit AhpC